MDAHDYPEPIFRDTLDDDPPSDRRVWTLRRIVMLLITLLIIVSFLTVFYLAPFITAQQRLNYPLPTPTVLPRF